MYEQELKSMKHVTEISCNLFGLVKDEYITLSFCRDEHNMFFCYENENLILGEEDLIKLINAVNDWNSTIKGIRK